VRKLIVLLALVANTPAFSQTMDAPITTHLDSEEGEFLVAGNGLSLYLFKADTQGPHPRSACEDAACVGTWPPLIVDAVPIGDALVRQDFLGTMTRTDGTMQATYNGWPLYFYYEDFQPGDIAGHDLESFGEDWYLIGPGGDRARRDRGDDDND
jgi:predicted lipoprotein with Yx(FWY)xxD motif